MFKNRLELVKNMMHNTYYLNFYVQVPVACISSSVLTFFKRFECLFFYDFLGFFQGKFWGFCS